MAVVSMARTPFDTLDSAHDYLRLLQQQITEVTAEIDADVRLAEDAAATRSLDALRLVTYKLHQLDAHVTASRGLMNDLKLLRRVLLGETGRAPTASREQSTQAPASLEAK